MKMRIASLAAAAFLAGCSIVPSSGPSLDRVVSGADEESTFRFEVVTVDGAVLSTLHNRQSVSFADEFRTRAAPPQRRIDVGDSISVTIFEAVSGGLFSPTLSDGAAAGARSVTLPEQRVSERGLINVPYAGEILAAGRNPEQIAADIETALDGQAIQPQALVTVTDSVVNQATVLGDVVGGGRVPLKGAGERILDVIAAVGGVAAPLHSVTVRLTRGEQTAAIPFYRVVSDPAQNIFVQPGDVITLLNDPETFTAFGATGRSMLAAFDDEELMLDEALGKVGGVIDARGEPEGLFVFRFEPRSFVEKIRPDGISPDFEGDIIPVAYQVNLREPSGFFYAQKFPMRTKDVVFVANADASELRKVLSLIGAVISPAQSGIVFSNTVQ